MANPDPVQPGIRNRIFLHSSNEVLEESSNLIPVSDVLAVEDYNGIAYSKEQCFIISHFMTVSNRSYPKEVVSLKL